MMLSQKITSLHPDFQNNKSDRRGLREKKEIEKTENERDATSTERRREMGRWTHTEMERM